MFFGQNRSALCDALQQLKAAEKHGLQPLASQSLKVQSGKRNLLALNDAALHSLLSTDPGDGPPAGNQNFCDRHSGHDVTAGTGSRNH